MARAPFSAARFRAFALGWSCVTFAAVGVRLVTRTNGLNRAAGGAHWASARLERPRAPPPRSQSVGTSERESR